MYKLWLGVRIFDVPFLATRLNPVDFINGFNLLKKDCRREIKPHLKLLYMQLLNSVGNTLQTELVLYVNVLDFSIQIHHCLFAHFTVLNWALISKAGNSCCYPLHSGKGFRSWVLILFQRVIIHITPPSKGSMIFIIIKVPYIIPLGSAQDQYHFSLCNV